jgi:hypothetical protein
MESKDITISLSENSKHNLQEGLKNQRIENEFRYGRSAVISKAQHEQDKARVNEWLLGGDMERRTPLDGFVMETTACKALKYFEYLTKANPTEEHTKKEQTCVISLKESKAKK